MKVGIIGLPRTGKKTLFELLSGHKPSEKELSSGRPVKSIAEIKDPRLDRITDIYKPRKATRARIDIELVPRLEKDVVAKGDIFGDIKELDAICHVVRAFEDDSVYHIEGFVDPQRDIHSLNSELILRDLLFIEKRMENIDKRIKQKREERAIKEKPILEKLKDHLEKNLPLRLLCLDADEKKAISSYPFITGKALLVVLNIAEDDIKGSSRWDGLKEECRKGGVDVIEVSAKVEAEIAALESDDERSSFLGDLGIREPAVNRLTRLCMKALERISFFTVASNEARHWTVRSGSTAPQAAGAIHTDMQRGFIRAEVVKFSDLDELGSEPKVKEAGKLSLKGKDYIVEDGDILNIRFNV